MIAPIIFDPIFTGISLTGLRAGISFNHTLPDITNAQQFATDPGFKKSEDLTLLEWKDRLRASVVQQAATKFAGGSFWDTIAKPVTLEGGGTILSVFSSSSSFELNGDILMSTDGKLLVRGDLTLGGFLPIAGKLFVDVSKIADAAAAVYLLADVPEKFKVLTLYGGVKFDFGSALTSVKTLIAKGPAAPQLGTGLALDGVANYASASGINLDAKSFTVEFWAKRGDQDRAETVVSQADAGGQGLRVGFDAANYFTYAFSGSTLSYAVHPDKLWHHYAVSFDSITGTRSMYLDGQLVNQAVLGPNTGINGGGDTFLIGEGGSSFFSGQLDEVRVWNTVRTASDIGGNKDQSIYGNKADLLGYWRFEEGSGTTVEDTSAHGNTATLTGFTPAQNPWVVIDASSFLPFQLGGFSISLSGGVARGRNGSNTGSGSGDAGLGGAIFNRGNLELDNTTLFGNHAVGGAAGGDDLGGAILNEFGSLNLYVSTLSGNTAQGTGTFSGAGGAVFNVAGSLDIAHSTLAFNAVVGGSPAGGALDNYDLNGLALVKLRYSIRLSVATQRSASFRAVAPAATALDRTAVSGDWVIFPFRPVSGAVGAAAAPVRKQSVRI